MPEKAFLSAAVDIQVPFYDLDPLDIVWHGNHVKYLEIARCALLDRIDYSILQMKASGYAWPVIELFLRYAQPLRFGQTVRVRADLAEWEARLKITYLLSDAGTGRRLARGHTVQVAVSTTTGEMCLASPEVLRRKMERLQP
jgi:acyl-CoA thioester hydrolase